MKWLVWLVSLLLFPPQAVYSATGVNIASQGASGLGLCRQVTEVSSAQLLDWHNTPITIVTAPGINNMIFPTEVATQFNPGTVAYAKIVGQANHPILFLDTFTSSVAPVLNNLLTSIAGFTNADPQQNMFFPLGESAQIWPSTTGTNTALKMKLIPTQQLTLGDGTLTITVLYFIRNASGELTTCSGTNPPPSVSTVPSAIPVIEVASLAFDSQYCSCSGGTPSATPTGAVCGTGGSGAPWACWLENINATGGFQANTKYHFQSGDYLMPSGLVVTRDNVVLQGDGRGVSILHYTATSSVITGNYAAVRFYSGCTTSVAATICDPTSNGVLRDITIRNNSFTGQKHVGVDLVDVFWFTLENVEISNFQSCYRCFNIGDLPGGICPYAHRKPTTSTCNFVAGYDGESVGLQLRGREEIYVNNVNIQADLPIALEVNPGYKLHDSPPAAAAEYAGNDHLTVSNVWLTGNSTALPIVYSVARIGSANFSGYQAWSGGCGGFKWINPTLFDYGQNFYLGHVRHEQGIEQGQSDALGDLGCSDPWEADIQLGATNDGYAWNVVIDDYFGVSGNGFRFRHVKALSLRNTFHLVLTPGLVNFDVDGTVTNLTLMSTNWPELVSYGAHYTNQTCFLASTSISTTHVPSTLACYGTDGG